jgi:hypothetical protein
MKWYKLILHDTTVANPYVADTGNLEGVAEDDLWSGISIANWKETAWVQASTQADDGDPDDALQTFLRPPVYSTRLRNALRNAHIEGIQYLPLQVLRPDGSKILGYSIVNVLNIVTGAIDLERSDFDVYPMDYFLSERVGKVRAIRNPVLFEKKLFGKDIVRLGEYTSSLFVSEKFKIIFEAGGFTGHSFLEIHLT